MNKKMLFFDIDGTLFTEGNHFLPPSTPPALAKARENGHMLFINTGRPFFNILPNIREIGFDGYVCGCGTYIVCHDEVLLHHTIPNKTCREIVDVLRDCNVSAMFEATDGVFFDYTRPATGHLASLQARFGARDFDISSSWDNPDLEFDKFVVWSDERSDFKTFYEYITKEFQYIDRGNRFGEIVPKGYSKATGIRFLQDKFHIPLEDCFAFGDSNNDLPMLEYVKNSVAMGNSNPATLFDICSYTTKDILEDGIEHALRHFHLID
ncbi:MAG: HAD family hydrolase [Lachnospiraceae bacterium]